MKILVCGSEGRILSNVIPRLLQTGNEVIGVDNCGKWGRTEKPSDYRLVIGSCGDPAVMRPLMKGIDGVIQGVATLYGVVGFHEFGADILINDISAHQTTIRLAAAAGVSRVVFLSSSVVYEQSLREPHREDDVEFAGIPKTDYGISKLTNERISQAFSQHRGLPFTIWRPFNVIDPEETASDRAGYSHVFADLMERIVIQRQNPLEILGDGEQIRSFLHIHEAAEAIAKFSFDQRTANSLYNVGRDEPITMKELAERIYERAIRRGLIPDSGPLRFLPRYVASTDVKRRIGSFEKIETELGWKSQVPLNQALEDCLDFAEARMVRGQAVCQ
jgi:UDP-glucose 4-epimerase